MRLTAKHIGGGNTLHLEKDPIFQETMKRNRELLRGVDVWLTQRDRDRSIESYGAWNVLTDTPIKVEERTTAADLVTYLARQLGSVCYLEIGVGLGMTFLQMGNTVRDSSLTGMDVEKINPSLERFLGAGRKMAEWQGGPFIATDKRVLGVMGSMTKYVYNSNGVRYLRGNLLREDTWERMAGMKFNAIFSDALHTPAGIEFEMEMLLEYDLIDRDNFFMVWDDIDGGLMYQAWQGVSKRLMREFDIPEEQRVELRLYGNYDGGWHGVNAVMNLC